MARARNIKPSFFKNELLVEMGPFDRLLFIGLWCLADREGRIEDRPKRIKMELFPCDSYDVDEGLAELQRHGFIKRYEAAGVRVISIVNFHKHQTPHGTEKDSELPDETGAMTVHDRGQNGYVTGTKRKNNVKSESYNGDSQLDTCDTPVTTLGENTLNPDSLNPDSLNPELGESTPAAQAAQPKPTKRRQVKTALPPDFAVSDRVREWASERGYNRLDEHLDAFKRKAIAKGYTYASWDDAFMEAIREDWAKLRISARPSASQPMSYAQQDEMARRARWEEMTGRKWPDDRTAPADGVIDVTPKALEIPA